MCGNPNDALVFMVEGIQLGLEDAEERAIPVLRLTHRRRGAVHRAGVVGALAASLRAQPLRRYPVEASFALDVSRR